MSKENRVFPGWKKARKGDRPPGSFPPKKQEPKKEKE